MTKLYAPEAFWNLTAEQKAEICNGCGTKGLTGLIVPNSLWFLSIREACNIHDFMYHVGFTIEDKNEADRTFLNNMVRLVDGESKKILRPVRRWRAMSYYSAVKDLGGPAFWESVSKPSQVRTESEVQR